MKIITTVGTSLITNSEIDCSSLEDIEFSIGLFDGKNESSLKKFIQAKEYELTNKLENGLTCAEIATLEKIGSNEKTRVYLLCTETILSYLCGRVIKRYLENDSNKIISVEFIQGLQVEDADMFKNHGFFNLLNRIRQIKHEDPQDEGEKKVLLNISGGYKALIPPMTLLAQLEKIPLYYIYEDSEELIETGAMPINFDWSVIEELVHLLHKQKDRDKSEFKSEVDRMRELKLVEQDSIDLTIIGQMLAEYSKNASPFTATIFGYFIEHKIYEMLAGKYGPGKVEHSVKIKGSEDIDILIKPENNKFISVEIKPSYRLDEIPYLNKTIKNIIDRSDAISGTGEDKKGKAQEVWLMVYSYSFDKKEKYVITNDKKNMLEGYANQIKQKLGNDVIFRVKHTFIFANKLGSERHIYHKFMKTKIKDTDVTEVFTM